MAEIAQPATGSPTSQACRPGPRLTERHCAVRPVVWAPAWLLHGTSGLPGGGCDTRGPTRLLRLSRLVSFCALSTTESRGVARFSSPTLAALWSAQAMLAPFLRPKSCFGPMPRSWHGERQGRTQLRLPSESRSVPVRSEPSKHGFDGRKRQHGCRNPKCQSAHADPKHLTGDGSCSLLLDSRTAR